MPSTTFGNLPQEKKKRFVEAALLEFAAHNFETASINVVIKKLNMARGSVYQYFENKLDLWLSLKAHCDQIKLSYIQSVNRFDFPDFWSYYRALYARGIDFDLEQPVCSRFLYRVAYRETSEEVSDYIKKWKEDANEMFNQWVEYEKVQGAINIEIPAQLAAHFMMSMSISIADFLHNRYNEFQKQNETGSNVPEQEVAFLKGYVAEMVSLLQKAMA
ncbi:MAG TPA: TetR/AcrR family transcriptional regulator [Bacteroidia bacterium]